MTATQPDSPRLTRRGLLRTTAVGVGAAAGVGALGSTARPAAAIDWGSVGKTAALAAVSPPVALGWALREFEVLGSDSPAEGLTADALKQQVYQTARTRKSTNASTIVDNQNILDGVENTAYTDAKIAAIEELNAGSSESAVLDAATAEINSYLTTVQSNFLKSWNEGVAEFDGILSALVTHPDIGKSDALLMLNKGDNTINDLLANPAGSSNATSYNLADGSTISVGNVEIDKGTESIFLDPINGLAGNLGDLKNEGVTVQYDGESVVYLNAGSWNPIQVEIETVLQNLRDGITTWVSSVYSDVQSGDIEISELITPRERAAMLSSEESEAQAIADLAALNIPIDPERKVTITISETGATLSGTIGLTNESDGPIESGATYDPSTFAGDAYFTTDVSQLSGTWDAYETGVDGGTITLTAQPYDGTVVNVTTVAGETVSVPATDWTGNGDGTYSYDASSELETTITEVDSAEYVSGADSTQYETLNLSKQFTVESIVNRQTGEQTSSASFESSEPQTDSNYITQEEWNQLEQQNQELIEKYEKSQSSGGAGAGWFEGSSPNVGLIAAVVGGAGVVYALFGQGGNS
ncbi:hypothetical protein HOV17_gp14 [Halorubrum pleomorphic virus 9]|uniref:Envelope protein N-terminal domain-containing protein n=1 Tax=Halorubrum pleomorphic virus 9 TaxID=2126525 RepID=A0A3S7IAM5_9VIRU|nr:hypothetical protein HOV17_gp14 [Halorubrum pleomorphic virus 9]AVP39978.1 hypothetical protein [Halorubrum pleomorphic virus 9]